MEKTHKIIMESGEVILVDTPDYNKVYRAMYNTNNKEYVHVLGADIKINKIESTNTL